MNSQETHLSQLIDALPSHFQFYHFGNVQMKLPSIPHDEPTHEPASYAWDETTAIAFQLHGDIRAMLFLLFPKGLDISLYSEMGNVIASRIVTGLSEHNGSEITLSPPQRISEDLIKLIAQKRNSAFHRSYIHLYNHSAVTLEIFVLPGPLEEVGYA